MNKRNKHIKKLSNYALVGGLSAFLITGLTGCEDKSSNNQNNAFSEAQKQNAFVVIEKLKDGSYRIADEFPSSKTTIVLRDIDGKERVLSQEEIDKLVKEEASKIDSGTSALTNPQMNDGHMGLGGVLLSSIAGAMIGSWIGNKLFNNTNYQNQRAAQYKSPQTYSRSKSSFSKAAASKTSSKKSGFFGSKSGSSRSTSFFRSFGG